MNPTTTEDPLTITVPLSKERFPSIFRDPKVKLTFESFDVLLAVKADYLADHASAIKLSLKAGAGRRPKA